MQSCWLQNTNSPFQQTSFDATADFVFRSAREEFQNNKQSRLSESVYFARPATSLETVMQKKMGHVICFCSDIVIILLCTKVFFETREVEAIVKKAAEPRTGFFSASWKRRMIKKMK